MLVKSKSVEDEMFIAAAKALADYVSADEIKAGKIYPNLEDLRDVSAQVMLPFGLSL